MFNVKDLKNLYQLTETRGFSASALKLRDIRRLLMARARSCRVPIEGCVAMKAEECKIGRIVSVSADMNSATLRERRSGRDVVLTRKDLVIIE
jgi:hypothetical protein